MRSGPGSDVEEGRSGQKKPHVQGPEALKHLEDRGPVKRAACAQGRGKREQRDRSWAGGDARRGAVVRGGYFILSAVRNL